jgi:hypothetical protein
LGKKISAHGDKDVFARCSWSTVSILFLVAAGSVAAEPPEACPTSPAYIEPPDILYLDGGFWLSQTTRGICGEHLIREDGTIALGPYGRLIVTGLTLSQARSAIEKHLSKWLQDPEISVSMAANNSKLYYVIIRDRDFEQVSHFPITGRETVLDAITEIPDLPVLCLKSRIWIVRPNATKNRCEILPVNWKDITQLGATKTNYQLFPGDQIHVGTGQPEPPTKPVRIHGMTILHDDTVTSGTPPQK